MAGSHGLPTKKSASRVTSRSPIHGFQRIFTKSARDRVLRRGGAWIQPRKERAPLTSRRFCGSSAAGRTRPHRPSCSPSGRTRRRFSGGSSPTWRGRVTSRRRLTRSKRLIRCGRHWPRSAGKISGHVRDAPRRAPRRGTTACAGIRRRGRRRSSGCRRCRSGPSRNARGRSRRRSPYARGDRLRGG